MLSLMIYFGRLKMHKPTLPELIIKNRKTSKSIGRIPTAANSLSDWVVRRYSGLFPSAHDGLVADFFSLGNFFSLGAACTFIADILEFFMRQMLNNNKRIISSTDTDKLIELDLNRCAIPVLRVLNQKHHEKSHDGRPRVNHELPCVRILKYRSRHRPDDHNRYRNYKR